MALLLGLQNRGELPPLVEEEFDQFASALQTQINAIGRVTRLEATEIVINGSGPMTWSLSTNPNLTHICYSLIGDKLLWLSFSIQSSTVGGTVSGSLQFFLPNGWYIRADRVFVVPFWHTGASGAAVGFIQSALAGAVPNLVNYLQFTRSGGVNWTAGATSIYGQIIVELV